jgi:tetratricopeptide (TPR) repeat protein
LQKAYLDTAFQLNPNSAEAYYAKYFLHEEKGGEYYNAGDYEKFEHESDEQYISLKKAIQFNNNHSLAYMTLSWFHAQRGLINLAIKYSTKSIELDPLYFYVYGTRGNSYHLLGEYGLAEADYNTALQFAPTSVWVLRKYMRLLIRMKRYEEAENMLLEAERIPPHPRPLKTAIKSLRAMLYFLRGEKDKVIEKDFSQYDRFVSDLILKKKEAVLLYMHDDLERVRTSGNVFTSKGPYYVSYLTLEKDTSFNFLRSDPRFAKIVAEHKKLYEENLEKYQDKN